MSTGADAAGRHLDIRKYPNRRYYDATHSRHLTLQEIRALIRDGYDVTVTDSRTGADITGQVLTQIILELETPKLDTFPVPLLLRVIRANDQLIRGFVDQYFNQALQSWLEYQKQLEHSLRRMPGLPGIFPPFAAWSQAGFPPAPPGPGSGGPTEPEAPATAPAAPPPAGAREGGDMRRVVGELQQQVEALRRELKVRARRKAGRRSRKR